MDDRARVDHPPPDAEAAPARTDRVAPPAAPVELTVTSIHGETRIDEYAWLRNRDDPDTIAYLEADGDIRTDTVRLAGNGPPTGGDDLVRALAYTALVGEPEVGDRVLLNASAAPRRESIRSRSWSAPRSSPARPA